jgi:hypothetical protein
MAIPAIFREDTLCGVLASVCSDVAVVYGEKPKKKIQENE